MRIYIDGCSKNEQELVGQAAWKRAKMSEIKPCENDQNYGLTLFLMLFPLFP
jgi:hypothetical protein